MQTLNADRERKSELFEIHYAFQEQGKRLSDCLARITAISNKLEDESGCVAEGKMGDPVPTALPGITRDLRNTVDGYRLGITQIEQQIAKIEKHI